MKGNRLLAATAAIAVLAVAGAASAAAELDLKSHVGYDSNVFSLNDTVGERDGMFTELDVGLGAFRQGPAGGEIGIDLGVAARLFESDVDDGNEEKYFVRARGDSGGKRTDHAFDWALRYAAQDTTYVSRFTGDVATSGGVSIGDRYDAGIGEARGAWHLPGGAYGRLSLEASVEAKDYRDDYAALGLDRLDYTQFGVEPQYVVGNRDRVRVTLPVALRQYRDRRVSDVNGNAVAGTDLEYTYYGLDAGYEHEFSRTSALELTGSYEIRQDNGVGYGDRTRWRSGVEWTHRPAQGHRLSAGVTYSSRVFDRPVTGNLLVNDETPEKTGYTLDVKYARPFPGVKVKDLALLAEGRWESYDNSNEVRYSYDRLEAFAGVRKEF